MVTVAPPRRPGRPVHARRRLDRRRLHKNIITPAGAPAPIGQGERDVDAAAYTVYRSARVTRATLIALDFEEDIVRYTDALFPIMFDDDGDGTESKFKGIGGLSAVSNIEETVELKAHTISVAISGIKKTQRAYVLQQVFQGRDASVWETIVDPNTYAIVGSPMLCFKGRMDTLQMRFGAGVGEIQMTIVDRLVDWDRPRIRRRTDADQQARFPGDKFFDQVDVTKNTTVTWGI